MHDSGFEILIPLFFIAAVAGVIIVPSWLKSRERQEMQGLLRSAIEKGQPVPPEVIDAMTKPVKSSPTSFSDVRTGVIWLAVGLGIAGFGFMMGFFAVEAFQAMTGIAAVPAAIGLAYVVLSFFNPNKEKRA
jgi:hypothetical protein